MSSRDIPAPIERILRQEACFGCCVCGHPFYEYHHIVPFSESGTHNPSDMMVLCPNDHHRCTVNALSTEDQRKAKDLPFNREQGFANGQFECSSNVIAIVAGSNQFIGNGFKILVDDEPLLRIRADKNGRLLLSIALYGPDDELLLLISDNEWITGDPSLWDFEFKHNRIVVRRAARQVSLTIDARSSPITISGTLWRKKQKFSLMNDRLLFNGVVDGVSIANAAHVAMSLVADTAEGKFRIVPDGRLGSGFLVSEPDPIKRLEQGFKVFDKLCREAKIRRNEHCPCGSGRKVKHCHQRPGYGA